VNRTRDPWHICHTSHTCYPAQPITYHTMLADPHSSRSKDSWFASYPFLLYETYSWRNAYCWCALHFWKYEINKYTNIQIYKYTNIQIYKYDIMKEENTKIKKEEKKQIRKSEKGKREKHNWVDMNRAPTDLPHLPHLQHMLPSPYYTITSNTISSKPIHAYPDQKSMARFIHLSVLWNIFLTECILFMRAAFLKIWNIQIW
jgi:hypothetical protein